MLELIENPPPTLNSHRNILREYVASLVESHSAVQENPIKKVEIIGHGLGSAVGLLIALGLKLELDSTSIREKDHLQITANLLGLPRVGNEHFGKVVRALLDTKEKRTNLQINRITSYLDTITHLPEKHLGLTHHSDDEIWVGPDPRFVYFCKSDETDGCSGHVELGKTSLMDHMGPYDGIRIDPLCKVGSSY
nr:uncharacterized protein I206_03042 [Kwoniella pini CBS 10737]OCF50980.1 hypothetical protein I206_03042 [Kwoniella pini CBS 10737]